MYISEAIESMLVQSFRDFELLIINDASSDGTKEKILEFQDHRIRYIENTENLKIANTLNKGLDLANGKYIVRMDADDISHPHRIETQLDFLERNTSSICCGSWIEIFSTQGKSRILKLKSNNLNILHSTILAHPASCFRAEFIKEKQIQYKTNAEDYYFWNEVYKNNDYKKDTIFNMPKVLLKYREHPKQLSSSNKSNIRRDMISVRRKNLLTFLHSHDINFDFNTTTSVNSKDIYNFLNLKQNLLDNLNYAQTEILEFYNQTINNFLVSTSKTELDFIEKALFIKCLINSDKVIKGMLHILGWSTYPIKY